MFTNDRNQITFVSGYNAIFDSNNWDTQGILKIAGFRTLINVIRHLSICQCLSVSVHLNFSCMLVSCSPTTDGILLSLGEMSTCVVTSYTCCLASKEN